MDWLRNNPKYFLRLFLVGLSFIVAIFVVWYFSLNSWVSVTANNENGVITIVSSSSGEPVKSEVGSFHGFLPVDKYIITASYDNMSASKNIDVPRFRSSSVSLDIPASYSAQPLTNFSVDSAYNTATGFTFLDSDSGAILNITNSGKFSIVNNSVVTEHLEWSPDGSVGVGVGTDSDERPVLVIVKNRSAVVRDVPRGINIGSSYIVTNDYLYSQSYKVSLDTLDYQQAGFELPSSGLLDYSNSVAAFSVVDDDQETVEFIGLENGEKHTIPVLFNESPVYHSRVAWSPDGTKLLLVSSGVGTVYESGVYNKLFDLPEQNLMAAAWQGNTIYYSTDNQVYKYNTESSVGSTVASLPQGNVVDRFYKNNGSGYVFFRSVLYGNSSVYYYGEKQLDEEPIMSLAGSDMQTLSNTCGIRYTGMSLKARLIIIGSDYNTAGCNDKAFGYLESIGVNPGDVDIQKANIVDRIHLGE